MRAASCSNTRGGSRISRASLENALAELRDNSAGRLSVGANESTTLYLLDTSSATGGCIPK